MRGRARGLALCLACLALGATPGAAIADALSDRVAIYRALVRGEPLPELTPRVAPSGWVCPRAPRGSLRSIVRRAVRDASLRFAVPPALIHSVIRHESAYDPNAVSHAGAIGLMQLMPATARELGVRCPTDPRQNVIGGTRYLRELYDRFGAWPDALAGYNAGPTAVEADRLPSVTRRYVRRVMSSWRRLDSL